MKTALIDVDGVCANFNKGFKAVLDMLSVEHGPVEVPDPPDVWGWDEKYYGKALKDRAWDLVLRERMYPAKFWGNLEFLDKKGLTRLGLAAMHDNIMPYFVTTRPFEGAERVTSKWLSHYYCDRAMVIQTSKKCSAAEAFDASWAIDDKPANLINILRQRGTKTTLYCPKYPWNEEVWNEPHIIMVKDLNEALEREGL